MVVGKKKGFLVFSFIKKWSNGCYSTFFLMAALCFSKSHINSSSLIIQIISCSYVTLNKNFMRW